MKTTDITNARFQFYKAPVQTTVSERTMSVADVYNYITTDFGAVEATRSLRNLLLRIERGEAERRLARDMKARRFDFCTFSGTFSFRRDNCLLKHSGLICLDFDHVGSQQELDSLKSRLTADPYLATVLLFVSPSGDGLKWVVPIDLTRASHESWFKALSNYIRATYQLEVDAQCSNVGRTCFLPHDASCIVMPDAPDTKTFFDIDAWASSSSQQPASSQQQPASSQQPASPQTAAQPASPSSDLERDVAAVVAQLAQTHTDITSGYARWLDLGFALADGLGEGGRQHYHTLSSLNADYNANQCDRQFTACLKSHGRGITIKTFFKMAKDAGVKLPPLTAIPPSGGKYTKNENTPYYNGYTKNNIKPPLGGMAVSGSNYISGYTFSDKIEAEELPKYLLPIFEIKKDSISRDMMLLGALNIVSGLLGGASSSGENRSGVFGIYDRRRMYAPLFNIIFGTAGSSKGDLAFCKYIAQPVKNEMRRRYEAEKAEYELRLAEWESQAKGKRRAERGTPPDEPIYRDPFVPGNSSSSAVYRTMDANDGWGMVFETEADTITNMLNSDYGNYSDLLRRVFHHESISMNRTGDRLHIDIDEPRLSVMLTCTPGQLPSIFPSFENGLGSRFLFYSLPDGDAEFRDVFADADSPLEDIFRRMGDQLLPLYHCLQARVGKPLQFVLSREQQREFNEYYGETLKEQFHILGPEIKAFVFRLALSCFRYAMVLTMLRRLSDWMDGDPTADQNLLFKDCEQAVVCDERDFKVAIAIVNCLINHTSRVYAILAKKEENPFAGCCKELTSAESTLFEALPAGEITTQQFVATAIQLKIPRRTAERMISKFCNVYRIIAPGSKRGIYHKLMQEKEE